MNPNSPTNYKYNDTQSTDFELDHCKVCNAMTNHLNGHCQKHLSHPACDDCQFEGGDHQTGCKHYVPTKWDIEKGKAVPACLCAGLRRRNAGLCLKCEVKRMHDTFPNLELDAYDDGYKHAKQDFLRLLEQ